MRFFPFRKPREDAPRKRAPRESAPRVRAPRKRVDRKRWKVGVVGFVVVLLAVALLAASGASSYDNLKHLAIAHHVPLPQLNPLELDFGLVVIALLDIVFTWTGHPLGGLRFLARILGVGTIAANADAGWPDPTGAFLRAFAPMIIVAITESVRTHLLRNNKTIAEARKQKRENRIPLARWLLSPTPTFILWRRMRLWDITGYRAAVDMELSRRQALVRLEMQYGIAWKLDAPADLLWMLTSGVRMAEALERVDALIETEDTVAALRAELDAANAARETDADAFREQLEAERIARETAQQETAEALTRAEEAEKKLASRRAQKPGKKTTATAQGDDTTTELRALMELRDDPKLLEPRMGGELARRLGVSAATGRRLHGRLVVDGRLVEPPRERSSENPDARSGERSMSDLRDGSTEE